MDMAGISESQLSANQLKAFISELNALCRQYGVFISTSVETDSSNQFQSSAVEIGQTVQPKGKCPQTVTLITREAFPC